MIFFSHFLSSLSFLLKSLKSRARGTNFNKTLFHTLPHFWHQQKSLHVNVKFICKAHNHSKSVKASVVWIIQGTKTPLEEGSDNSGSLRGHQGQFIQKTQDI